ncbi:MAG TPA: bifunctional diguanylate cyclase/phosphodiesterase [Xanthobacteraceae bacterium]|jgi:diguanylate cyclase (GGDEF)-like protein|nr:bifunctional diguanylate cyclase/phosphodiesterase [Xanthobacteraceae bacterium]
MKAAVEARSYWARRRAGRLHLSADTARVGTVVSFVLALFMLLCAAAGLFETQRNDSRRLAEQHDALHTALGELRGVLGDTDLGDSDQFDAGQIALIERRSGLRDLRFDGVLADERGREVQSVHDPQGRILGWFSWAPDRAFVVAMNWLWGLLAGTAVMLAAGAYAAMRATRRLAVSFARGRETIRRLTTKDDLTGLPNRRAMLQKLDDVIAARGARLVVFALIDIDTFREINDALGHAGGDTMLCAIAERLKSALPPGAVLGRFQDDEFAAIAAGENTELATQLADKLSAALADPIFMDQQWQISGGIGLAQSPQDGTTGDELQRHAALALRTAKRSGRGVVRRFVPQIHEQHAERRFFLRELETAIAQNAFNVHYQPVVAAEGGAMVGVEALMRWTHPTRGPIAPSLFIPLAEESGLMIRLGEIVMRRALADGARWPSLFVSVNLSPVQMRSRGLTDFVAAVLAESGMPASRLVLEITEGILIDDPEETQRKLEGLRGIGVSTALDDFGTGYSSLSYLQKFPFDRLKIDRSFVASLGTTGNAGAIIQSIVTLGHALGMKVLAEGVETNEQRVLLRLAGCDEMQGFLFAKACPAESIDKILARAAGSRGARTGTNSAS